MLRHFFIYFLVIVTCGVERYWGQNKTVDSLKQVLSKELHDSTRCRILIVLLDQCDENEMPVHFELLRKLSDKNLQRNSNRDEKKIFLRYLAKSHEMEAYWLQVSGEPIKAIKSYELSLAAYRKAEYKKGEGSALNNLGFIYKQLGKTDESEKYLRDALEIHKANGNYTSAAKTMINLSSIYSRKGDYNKALDLAFSAMDLLKKTGDERNIATAYNHIGTIYSSMADIGKALDFLSRSLKLNEKFSDTRNVILDLNQIAIVYVSQGDSAMATEYFTRSMKIAESVNDQFGVAQALNNLGALSDKSGRKEEGKEYYKKSLSILEKLGNKEGMAYCLNNIAGILTSENKLSEALNTYSKSLSIREQIGDKKGMGFSLSNIGETYYFMKKYKEGEAYATKALVLGKEMGSPEILRNSARVLVRIFKANGNYLKALENYELYIQMRDSINNETTRKASIRSQLKYEYEKQAAADSVAHAKESEIKNAELKRQEAEIKAKKNQQYALFGGLALVMVFAGFMFNRWKVTQKQKAIIEEQKTEVEEQKKLVEEKQKEILDSIRYAKRIQLAQIPSEKRVSISLSRLKR